MLKPQSVPRWCKAAEQGDAGAQNNLGTSYFYGKGVKQDDVAAADCWRKAAEQGHAEAQYTLGVLYFNGWGVPQDILRAEFWYRKAAEQGDAYAQEALAAIRETDSREIGEFQDEVRKLNPKAQRNFSSVLIVDNEPVITDTLALILAHYGYRCSKAYNGWAGLARAREVKPDMVISGVINGDGPNGIEMAIQILAEMPETKILLFSGQAATVDLLAAASAKGHDLDLVSKPVEPVALKHWCDLGGVHDIRSCQWCRERWVGSGGAYPHGERRDCACSWCRALAAG